MSRPECLLCHSGNSGLFVDIQGNEPGRDFEILRCADCGFVYLFPPLAAEEVSRCYPKEYWWTQSKDGFLSVLERIYRDFLLFTDIRGILALVPKGKVLDVGCGKGDLLRLLREKGLETYGLETASEAARGAREVYGLNVDLGELVNSKYDSEYFDAVTFFHVLEHVNDPCKVLREANRILKNRGLLVVQVPNIESLQFRISGRKWYGLQVPSHLSHFSPRTLKDILEQTGFEIIRMSHFSLRCNSMILVSSLFPSLSPQALLEISGKGKNPQFLKLSCFALTLLFQPLVLLESVLGRGAVITVFARKGNR